MTDHFKWVLDFNQIALIKKPENFELRFLYGLVRCFVCKSNWEVHGPKLQTKMTSLMSLLGVSFRWTSSLYCFSVYITDFGLGFTCCKMSRKIWFIFIATMLTSVTNIDITILILQYYKQKLLTICIYCTLVFSFRER